MESGNFMEALGGIALFLYGMRQMSGTLGSFAGERERRLLERLTTHRVAGVLAGCAVTAVLQSSSATTVLVVGLVDAETISLYQAVWIIMGANIGTTVTGQLMALDVGRLAPAAVLLGVILLLAGKKEQSRRGGELTAALGILFLGMEQMCRAFSAAGAAGGLAAAMGQRRNPLWGIVSGTLLAAVMQSSSAAVGMLQALAGGGGIPLDSAAYVLFGQNIGTCVTALLASAGRSRNARRAALIHLAFNVTGAAVFTALCMGTPLLSWIERLTPQSPAAQIANLHTVLNAGTTLLLLPVGEKLAKWAEWMLPETTKCKKRRIFEKSVRK